MMNAIWGKLACEILMQNWDVALEDLNRLRETIESTVCCVVVMSVSVVKCLRSSDVQYYRHIDYCDIIIHIVILMYHFYNYIDILPHVFM